MFFIHREDKEEKPKCIELDFEYMHEKYKNLVWFIASKGISDYHLKEELAQDVFVKFSKVIDRFSSEEKAVRWIKIVTKNTMIDYYRRESTYKSHIFLTNDEIYYAEKFSHSYADTSEEYVLKKEIAKELRPFIRELSVKQEAVIDYYYYMDMTPQEISVAFDIPLYTVYSRLRKARKVLEKVITDYYTRGGPEND